MKNIIVISTSLRKNGNSERLADAFVKGAKEAGHMVEKCSLQGCAMHFCTGCMTCQHSRQGQCAMPDDADILIQKMAAAMVCVILKISGEGKNWLGQPALQNLFTAARHPLSIIKL